MILTHVDLIEKLLKYVPSLSATEQLERLVTPMQRGKGHGWVGIGANSTHRYNASEREQARAARGGR